MQRAKYVVLDSTQTQLIIKDIGPWSEHPTVTNDAEAVVADLAPRLYGRRLLYFDSFGDLDELLVRNGKFAGFAPYERNSLLAD